jgi:arylsulfatase A-like enzyme
MDRPNIILIMVESWDGKTALLEDQNITPNLDKYIQNGVQFKYNYTTQPICCPARSNLWSGQYTHHCKSWNNYHGLEDISNILPRILQKEGNYILPSKNEKRFGIGKHDYWCGKHSNQNRITAWTGAANIERPSYLQKEPIVVEKNRKKYHIEDWYRSRKANKFLKKQKKRQDKGDKDPFFLYLSYTTPHPRFRTSQYWLDKVNYDQVTIPPKDDKDTLHPTIKYQLIQKDWRWGLDPESVKKTRSIYYAMVAETDAFIGEVLKTVENLGLNDNTYVIITADHGENNMEHDLFYKMNFYEASVNVPLYIRGPGIRKGLISEKIVSLIDLYPTILDMAEIPMDKAPHPIDGESLLPYLKGETEKTRDWAFSIHTGTACNTSIYMLREGDWKYNAYFGYEPQLFNLKEDPDEIHNYAEEKPDIVAKMDKKLRQVCNIDEVHKEWQKYCKESFREYRDHTRESSIRLFEYGAKNPRAFYDDIIANTYKGWNEEDAQKLEKWLNTP